MPDFDQLKNFVISKIPSDMKSKTLDSLKSLFATVGMPVDNIADVASHHGSWKGLWEKATEKGMDKLALKEMVVGGLAAASNVALPGSGYAMEAAFNAGAMLHVRRDQSPQGRVSGLSSIMALRR